MKILHIDPDDIASPWSGGGPIRTFEINRRLAGRHDITVLTPTFPGCKKEEWKEGIRYLRIGRRYGNHNSSHFISFYLAAPFAAREFDCDLLVEDLMPPTVATLTPLLNRKRMVASVQWFSAKAWADRYKIPFHWYQPFGLKLYKHFIVLTEEMKRKVLQYNPRAEFSLIPNGINEIYFQSNPQPGEFILYLGRVENSEKGVDLLLQAYEKIAKQTAIPLVIAGDGVDLERGKAMAACAGLTERVTFIGRVGPEKKRELFSRCAFVCIPSRHETFSMVALEAFASAKTVIAFDIPFLEIMKPDFSVKVRPFDIEAYAGAMLQMLREPEKNTERGFRAREFARTLLWDRLALIQEAYYEKVARNGN